MILGIRSGKHPQCYFCGDGIVDNKGFSIEDEFDSECVKRKKQKEFLIKEKMEEIRITGGYYERQAERIAKESTMIKCPYCSSKNVKKIGTVSKVISAEVMGLASSKIGKQWHCKNCNSNF